MRIGIRSYIWSKLIVGLLSALFGVNWKGSVQKKLY